MTPSSDRQVYQTITMTSALRKGHNYEARASYICAGLSTTLRSLLPALVLVSLGSCSAAREDGEEISIYPEVLYGGNNAISVSAPSGIASVTIVVGDEEMVERTELRGAGRVEGCPTMHDVSIRLDPYYTSHPYVMDLRVVTCGGTQQDRRISLSTFWRLDTVLFPKSEPGEESCAFF